MQTAVDEIVLPETKPETEWILGEAVQKVSPTRRHARLQGAARDWLLDWAAGRGDVLTEWRFRVTPAGERTRPLVPDVAYLADARTVGVDEAALETPLVAPDIVVEILSPDDRPVRVREKLRVYRSAGVALVLLVDPERRTVERYDADGSHALVGEANATIDAFPGLTLPHGPAFFAVLDRPRAQQ